MTVNAMPISARPRTWRIMTRTGRWMPLVYHANPPTNHLVVWDWKVRMPLGSSRSGSGLMMANHAAFVTRVPG